MPTALKISNLNFRYYEHAKENIIKNFSLSIESGTITIILGRSGCGKSTLAALVAGLYPENGGFLESGKIEIFGHDIKALNHSERAKYLTLMFQNPDLQFCMNTLRKEIIFCLENISTPPDEMDEIIFNVTSKLGMLDLLDRKLSTLSGGEKQKASLCCLMAIGSKCIVLDEALANIDEESAREIIALLQDYKESGGTVIAIEHRPELWKNVADSFFIMKEHCSEVEKFDSQFDSSAFNTRLVDLGIFGAYTAKKFHRALATTNAISLKNFSVFEGDKCLIQNSSASFKLGRITAILGRSGAGKTTIFKCILKQHDFKGSIEIYGDDIRKIKERDLFSKIGIVFQNPANQFITQRVNDEVRASMDSSLNSESLEKILDEYDLRRFERYSPYMLSQGQQRRLAVLSILVGKQKILLLDEPTYGQDLSSTEAMMRQLNSKVEHDNLTVIFITHDARLAECWADEIIKIEGGKFITCNESESKN